MAPEKFYLIVSSFWKKLSVKTSLLVRSEILRLFVNTFTTDDKYSRDERQNLPELIQMQLPRKSKTFKQIFTMFLKSKSHLKHFEKADEPHSLNISEIIDSERRGYLNV